MRQKHEAGTYFYNTAPKKWVIIIILWKLHDSVHMSQKQSVKRKKLSCLERDSNPQSPAYWAGALTTKHVCVLCTLCNYAEVSVCTMAVHMPQLESYSQSPSSRVLGMRAGSYK